MQWILYFDPQFSVFLSNYADDVEIQLESFSFSQSQGNVYLS